MAYPAWTYIDALSNRIGILEDRIEEIEKKLKEEITKNNELNNELRRSAKNNQKI